MLVAGLLVLGLTQAATPPTSATIEVRLVLPDDFTPGTAGVVTISATPIGTATRHPEEGEPTPTAAVGSLQDGIPLRVSPGLWRLTAEAGGLWSVPAEVLVHEGSNTTTYIRAWPLGFLEGTLVAKPGGKGRLPERVHASLEILGTGEAGVFTSTEPCRVEGERLLCELPATRLTIRLQPEGYVPRYFHDVLVSTREPTRVGTVLLERGSSIVGKVVDVGTERPAAGASVQLRSAQGEVLGPSFAAAADQAGYFQLVTPNPGAYTVHATARNRTAVSEPFRVDVADDLRLSEPLGLQPPLTLRIRVEPALDPEGMQWHIGLTRVEGTDARLVVRDSVVDRRGRWLQSDLVEGQYSIKVSTGSGANWTTTVVDLHTDTGEVEIEGQACSLRGSVRLGGEPLTARLVFTNGPLGHLTYQSDEDGAFEGRIPCREDLTTRTWTLLVEAAEWRGFVHGVELVGGVSEYEADVRMSDSVVDFVVVDDGGYQLAGEVAITVWNADHPERRDQAKTGDSDAPGQVALAGLVDGSYVAQAKAPPDRVSEPHTFEVTPTSRRQTVELVVRRQLEVSGIVTTADGTPVASASLQLLPTQGVFFTVGVVQTDASGRFSARLPAETTEVALRASAYGTAFRLARVPVAADRPLMIRLETQGGTLVLRHAEPLMSDTGTYVLREGAFVDASTLVNWAAAHGQAQADDAAIIPAMQEGPYQVCRVGNNEAALLFSGQPPSRCESGYLARGSELELKVPPTAP